MQITNKDIKDIAGRLNMHLNDLQIIELEKDLNAHISFINSLIDNTCKEDDQQHVEHN